MIIKKIEIGEFSVPLAAPFRTALRTVESIRDVAVRITADTGEVGYGEAPPTAVITGDTRGSVVCAIRDFIGPAILGMEIENPEGIMERLHGCIQKNTSAKACVDMAVYDLYGKRYGAPLYKLLGGYRNEIETDLTISLNPVDEMVRDSLEAVGRGYRILKVKVGRDSAEDMERIAAIRGAVGKEVKLRVDANQGWAPKEAIRVLSAMEDKGFDLELCEQPVKAHDLDGLRAVTNAVATPILADESVFSPEDALEILHMHAADLINIKLMKTGGIYGALKLCAIAETCGVECMAGCMLESKLAVSAAAHLAAAKRVITRADLDGPSLCRTDPFEGGPEFRENRIVMNDLPGIGIRDIPGFRPIE